MKIKIIRHVVTKDYAHYPGQIMDDVHYERELLECGAAVPVGAGIEAAIITRMVTAEMPSTQPTRPANIPTRRR